MHIVSAHLGELGLTLGQRSVDGKTNEIPAVQALLEELDIIGCMIVADALNCQKETARKSATSSNRPVSNIMFGCLLDPAQILNVISL